ncbi:MAG TPA: CvpA family protein, partial [Candidatus Erysipelatoclostridium merdavium]|nr:CvpA family protein [Candidatus Erysipelatoclostridium merdavium]
MNKIKDLFSSFVENFHFRSQVVKQPKKFALLKALIITLVIGIFLEYLLLLPINLRSPQFVGFFCFLLFLFVLLYRLFKGYIDKLSKVLIAIIPILIVYLGVGTLISSPIFNAKKYQQQLK